MRDSYHALPTKVGLTPIKLSIVKTFHYRNDHVTELGTNALSRNRSRSVASLDI